MKNIFLAIMGLYMSVSLLGPAAAKAEDSAEIEKVAYFIGLASQSKDVKDIIQNENAQNHLGSFYGINYTGSNGTMVSITHYFELNFYGNELDSEASSGLKYKRKNCKIYLAYELYDNPTALNDLKNHKKFRIRENAPSKCTYINEDN